MIIVTISVMRTIFYSSVRSKRTDNISLIEPRSFFVPISILNLVHAAFVLSWSKNALILQDFYYFDKSHF